MMKVQLSKIIIFLLNNFFVGQFMEKTLVEKEWQPLSIEAFSGVTLLLAIVPIIASIILLAEKYLKHKVLLFYAVHSSNKQNLLVKFL